MNAFGSTFTTMFSVYYLFPFGGLRQAWRLLDSQPYTYSIFAAAFGAAGISLAAGGGKSNDVKHMLTNDMAVMHHEVFCCGHAPSSSSIDLEQSSMPDPH